MLDIQLIKKMAWMACRIMYFLIHQKPFENNCFRVVKTAKTLTVIKRKICWLRIHKFYELRPSFTLCYLRRSNSTKLFNNLESLRYFGTFWLFERMFFKRGFCTCRFYKMLLFFPWFLDFKPERWGSKSTQCFNMLLTNLDLLQWYLAQIGQIESFLSYFGPKTNSSWRIIF